MKTIIALSLIIASMHSVQAQESNPNKSSETFLSIKAGYVGAGNVNHTYINGFQPGIEFVQNNRHSHTIGINNLLWDQSPYNSRISDSDFSIGLWYQYKIFLSKKRLAPYASIGVNPVYKYFWFRYYELSVNYVEINVPVLIGLNYQIADKLNLFADCGFNLFHFPNALDLFNIKSNAPKIIYFAQSQVNLGVSYKIK